MSTDPGPTTSTPLTGRWDSAARRVIPYGAWPSPISADLVAQQTTTYDAVTFVGCTVYWLEGRPAQGGRTVLVGRRPDGRMVDLVPEDFAVGTRVHEYGGGAYLATPNGIVASRATDDRVWWLTAGRPPRRLTPPCPPGCTRYADFRLALDGQLVVCVRERHLDGGEVVNELAAFPLSGTAAPWVLAGGHDHYAAPRPSPDGRRLAWLTWDSPQMPWDGTELWVAELDATGHLERPWKVAGGPDEAIVQPEWGPDGALWFVSDRSGWWNLYRHVDGDIEPMHPMDAEFAEAPWELDYATYAFTATGQVVCRYRHDGSDHLGILDPVRKTLQPLALPFTEIKPYLGVSGHHAALIAASPTTRPVVATVDLTSGAASILAGGEQPVAPDAIARPRPITFPSGNTTGHARWYPPTNPTVTAPPQAHPPLIVQPHSGPTAAAKPRLELRTQFFTSRGFAVVDVDYAGSTGYGRAYRERLTGQWGIADVADCVAVAVHLAEIGAVDPDRLLIAGASAGGFTTLSALATTEVFAAGVSMFGITDLVTYRQQAPKFQRPALERLIGPYPQAAARYHQRSPARHATRIRRPLLLLQGLGDSVVPPAQSAAMVQALQQAGVPCTYLTFADEGHGLKQPANIRTALEAERLFYRKVLDLRP